MFLNGLDINLSHRFALIKNNLFDFLDEFFLIEDLGMSLLAVLVEVGDEVLDILLHLLAGLLLLGVHFEV